MHNVFITDCSQITGFNNSVKKQFMLLETRKEEEFYCESVLEFEPYYN